MHAQTIMAQSCNTRLPPCPMNSFPRSDRIGTESLANFSGRIVSMRCRRKRAVNHAMRAWGWLSSETRFRKNLSNNRLHEHYSPDPTLSIVLQHGRRGILDHALHNDYSRETWLESTQGMRGCRNTFASSSRQANAALNDDVAHQVGITAVHQSACPSMIRTIAKRFFGKDRTQPKREGGMAFRRRPIPVPALTSSADSREPLAMVPRLLGLGRLPDLEQLVVASTTAGRDDDWMKRSPPRYGRSDVREPSGGTFDPRMSDPNATRESCVCRR